MLCRFHAYFFRIFLNDTLIFSLFIGFNTISLDPKFPTVLISIFLEASFYHYFLSIAHMFFSSKNLDFLLNSRFVSLDAYYCSYTMCCISLSRCCLGLETKVVIKISRDPCYPISVD